MRGPNGVARREFLSGAVRAAVAASFTLVKPSVGLPSGRKVSRSVSASCTSISGRKSGPSRIPGSGMPSWPRTER